MLTSEEKVEFTALNYLAYTLIRENGKKTDTAQPCWLCLCKEAKENAVLDAIKYLNDNVSRIFPFDKVSAEHYANEAIGHMLPQWEEAEAKYKELREEGNPRAYFSPVG